MNYKLDYSQDGVELNGKFYYIPKRCFYEESYD